VGNAQWPDDKLSYVPLMVSGDNGFPQAFRQQIAGIVYRMTLAVIYTDPAYVLSSAYAGMFFDLLNPERGLFLNIQVEREDQPDTERLIGVRRVVLDMPIPIGPLRFRFSRIKIAQRNLVRPGQSGSELVAEVAVTNA